MKEKTWFTIVNPAGGYGTVKKRWPQLEEQLRNAGVQMELAFTQSRGHATILAREAIESGHRHILAVGGDGTNNEAINGILQQKTVPPTDVCYALLPVGTGNDWIRTMGIPLQMDSWLEMFEQGHTTIQDIGIAEYTREGTPAKRFLANVAGMSFDAYVAKFMDENRGYIGGRFAYLFALVRCLAKFKLPLTRIHANGYVLEDHCYTINAGICRYSGGGMQLVPHAIPDDGLFALTVAKKVSKLGVLLATPYFYNGKIDRHPKIETHSARTIRVEAMKEDHPVGLEVDGEFLGYAPVSFSLIEKALQVVAPSPR
ncbi:MAG: diacylglycerol kinase family lipid kinase [Saprospirales bacterium]|nr:diacylglycerol kinase family lipid kinase [Saprospirales bacterium]